ncbi:MAG: DUF3108 domain-containing protein [Akkermansiaceae bacterium]|nr:DUF3108 domain-containing protein [Akkermansiaceae bacterium]
MRFLPLLLAVLLLPLPASAWQASVNAGKPGPHLRIKPVQLRYVLSWDGKLNSGDMTFIFGRPDKRYPRHFIAQAYGGSSGIAKTFYPYKYSFTSILNKADYTPAVFIGNEVDGKERKETSNRYGGSVKSTEVTVPLKKGAAKTTRTTFFSYSKSTVHDFLSAILYIRSLPLKNGDRATMVLHPFASPYLAKVTVLGREAHRGRDCIRLGLELQKIDRATMKLRSYKKMKSATMWITDDAERLPIEIRSKVFVGDVRAVLTERKFL